jgi:hypothetical protein
MGKSELIPLRLPVNTPQEEKKFNKKTAMHLSWDALYIPSNVLHKLMINQYNWLNLECIWRSGAWLSWDDNEVLLVSDDRSLNLYINASNPLENYTTLEIMRKEIRKIFSDMNIFPNEMLHYTCLKDADGNLVKDGKIDYLSVCKQYKTKPNNEIYLAESDAYVKPDVLLMRFFREETIKGEIKNLKIDKIVINSSSGIQNIVEGNQKIKTQNATNQTLEFSDEDINKIVTMLKYLITTEELPNDVNSELQNVLDGGKSDESKKNLWNNITSFLGVGGNLATIIDVATNHLPKLVDYLGRLS